MFTDDKDYVKVIADGRLKLEGDAAPAMLCIEKDDSRGKPQAGATSFDARRDQIQKVQEHSEK